MAFGSLYLPMICRFTAISIEFVLIVCAKAGDCFLFTGLLYFNGLKLGVFESMGHFMRLNYLAGSAFCQKLSPHRLFHCWVNDARLDWLVVERWTFCTVGYKFCVRVLFPSKNEGNRIKRPSSSVARPETVYAAFLSPYVLSVKRQHFTSQRVALRQRTGRPQTIRCHLQYNKDLLPTIFDSSCW